MKDRANTNTTSDWDMIIEPRGRLFHLGLRELWRYRDLVMLFIRRDFVAVYKQTVLGPLWYILQPLLMTAAFTIVFGNIAGMPVDGAPPFLFYMAGSILWTYFATTLTKTSDTFIVNASVFGKVYFPRLAVPVSLVLSNLISFSIQLLLFIVLLVWYSVASSNYHISKLVLVTPVLICVMAGLALGLGVIVSALTTKYRDLRQLITFGVQLAMYATPVIYPLSTVPQQYRLLIMLNPMTAIVESFRTAFLGTGVFEPMHLLYSCGMTIIILIIGVLMFTRVERTFMDTV
ncbi:MAG: ABC transporter permease [Bacteroidota bacterium]